MESYKIKSRIITILVTITFTIITYIAAMNPDNLANTLGVYGNYAPIIIIICGAIINQASEEKRVTRAEEIIEHNYTKLGYPRTNEETEINTTTDDIATAIQIMKEEDEELTEQNIFSDVEEQ